MFNLYGRTDIRLLCAASSFLLLALPVAAAGWVYRSDMNVSRSMLGGAAGCGYVYSMGGHLSAATERYDATADTWTSVSSMPDTRGQMAIAFLDGYIYAVAGEVGNSLMNTNERYSCSTDQWEMQAVLPKSVVGAGAASFNGKLYVFCPGNEVYRYDPSSDAWTQVGSMPGQGEVHGIAQMGSYIYIAGGTTPSLKSDRFWAYDPVANKWYTDLPKLNQPRCNHKLLAANGRLYAISGTTDTEVYDGSVERWEPGAAAWEVLSDELNTPRAHFGAAVGADTLYVFGGYDASGTLKSTEALGVGEPARLVGRVLFQSRDSGAVGHKDLVEVELKNTGTGVVSVVDVITDESGAFVITDVAAGTYSMTVKEPNYLRKRVDGVVVGSTGGSVDFGGLDFGDANDDNAVSWLDIGPFSGGYGQTGASRLAP